MMKNPQARIEPVMRERNVRIDALRGLAITLVVLGHALVNAVPARSAPSPGLILEPSIGFVPLSVMTNPLLNVIYTFHMPLFAFLSGFVLFGSSKGHGWSLVKSRFFSLMVPYFAWMFVWWLLGEDHTLLGLVRYLGFGAVNDHAPGALWFLYALFVCVVLYVVVRTLSQSEWVLVASAGLVGVAGVIPVPPGYEHVLGLSDVAWVYPFFVLGFIAAKHRRVVEGLRYGFAAGMAVWLLSLPLVWPINVPGPRWWFAPLAATLGPPAAVLGKAIWAPIRVLGALGGVATCYYGFAWLEQGALRLQAWLGRRSLGLYATHGFFLALPLTLAPAPRVAIIFVQAMVGAILLGLLLERFRWTRIVLLGMRT